MLALGMMTVAQRIGLAGTGATDRVVVIDRSSEDGHHRAPFVRPQNSTGAKKQVALRCDGVLSAIAFGVVGG